MIDFLPLALLIGITIGTFVFMGSSTELIEGIGEGLKGVVLGSVILILAITIGGIAKQTGGGVYLVETDQPSRFMLPAILMTLTVIIAFSTGTSWGTYGSLSISLAIGLERCDECRC